MSDESNVFDNILIRNTDEVIHSRFYQYVISVDVRANGVQTLHRVREPICEAMHCVFNPIVSNLVGIGLYTGGDSAPRGYDECHEEIPAEMYRARLKGIFMALSEEIFSKINWQSVISLRCLKAFNDCKLHSMAIEDFCTYLKDEFKSDNLFILSVSC